MPFDAIILGAGPAGCAAAYDLAQAGRRVLLLDRRSFPRPKACACGLTRKTLAALRYSVDPIIERRCTEIILQPAIQRTAAAPDGPSFAALSQRVGSSGSPDLATTDRTQDIRIRNRKPIAAMAVRSRFDKFCLDQTLAAGRDGGEVIFRKIETATAFRDLGTHIELDIRTADQQLETLTAPVLIGADGSNGVSRRLASVLQPTPQPQPQNRCHPEQRQGSASSGPPTKESPSRPKSSQPYREDAVQRSASVPTTESSSRPERSEVERSQHLLSAEAASNPSFRPERRGEQSPAFSAAQTQWYHHGFALEATIPYALLPPKLPAADAPHDLIFDFAPLPGGYGWLFPKGDHINIGVGAFADSDPAHLKAVTRHLLTTYTLTKLGVDLTALPADAVTGQHLGMGGHAYVPTGRILLTGDAAGLVDPLTGEGIHSAILSGQAAAAAILETAARTVEQPGDVGPPERGSFSYPNDRPKTKGASAPEGVAAVYARHLRPLQQTLAFSARAARAFYREPARGFRAMRNPLLRWLVLRTYTDGLPHTGLITTLAKFFAR